MQVQEPLVCLDELHGDALRADPLEAATETIAECFHDAAVTRLFAKQGHEQAYTRALVALFRSEFQYEVFAAGDFACIALVRQVPPPALPASGDADDEAETEQAAAGDAPGSSSASRAEASANVEPSRRRGEAPGAEGALAPHAAGVDRAALRAAVAQGDLAALLALGVPRLEAELLVHQRPGTLEAGDAMQAHLMARLHAFAQACFAAARGPLLHLHFLATRAGRRGAGLGRRVLQHLERMADAEHKHVYLEASSAAARRLYQRHGFQDLEEYTLGGEGGAAVTFFLMARPPGAPPAPPSGLDVEAAAQALAGEAQHLADTAGKQLQAERAEGAEGSEQ